MKNSKKFLTAAAAMLALVLLSGCSGALTPKELAESDTYFTVDACQITGSMEESVLHMQVDYTVTNNNEEAVSEITLLTPYLEENPMKELELLLQEQSYTLKAEEKDVVALDEPIQPGGQAVLSITYYMDALKMPDGGTETWRITLPTLDKSAIATGEGSVKIVLSFDQAVELKSSMPLGLEQSGETGISGELGTTVNLLVLDVA